MIRTGARYGTRERILSTMKVEVHRVSWKFWLWKMKQALKMFFRREKKRIIVMALCLVGTALCTFGIMANMQIIREYKCAMCYRGGGNLGYYK